MHISLAVILEEVSFPCLGMLYREAVYLATLLELSLFQNIK
jgi:hypothetical protein